MKIAFEFIVVYLMMVLSLLVNAWGYQVIWNDLVLNIWQLFSTGDVINTYNLSYGVCFAIAVSLAFIAFILSNKKSDSERLSVAEASGKVFAHLISKLIMIGIVILVTAIVF